MLRLSADTAYDPSRANGEDERWKEVKAQPPTTSAVGQETAAGNRSVLVLLMVVALFGMTWPVIKIGLSSGATPLWFAVGRAGLSAFASFLLLLALGRLRLPPRADLPIVASVGVLQLMAFFALVNLGLRHVPAGRSAVLAYTTTLWLAPLSAAVGERIGLRRGAGILVGFAGVAAMINPLAIDWSDRDVLWGHGVLLLAALSWALAIFHSRRHRWRATPLDLLPWQMLLATALLAVLAAWAEPDGRLGLHGAALPCLLFLGFVAGPLGSWAAMTAQRALPLVVSSLGFLGVPVVGIAVSLIWLGETLTPNLIAGSALIIGGLVLVTLGARKSPTRERNPPLTPGRRLS
jgi:drug/metabolite transporter (DMT)-like permease